jgi:hypothetical protein
MLIFTWVTVDPYYLPTFNFPVGDSDSNKLKEFLRAKIEKRKNQIHPAHSARFNHHMQLQIDSIVDSDVS